MLKKCFSLIKKIILSFFVLYGYNLIAISFGLMIPINFFTVLMLSVLGFPALLALVVILIVVF